MPPSPPFGTLRSAAGVFLEVAAASAGLVAGIAVPVAGVAGACWLADLVDERRRGRPVAVELRADDLPAYHLALLKPGEVSWVPPNAIADIAKAKKLTIKRRP